MWLFYINLKEVIFLKLILMLFDFFQAIQLLYETFFIIMYTFRDNNL